MNLIVANSADPGEMQHYAAFHLGLDCLQKYSFNSVDPHEMLLSVTFYL